MNSHTLKLPAAVDMHHQQVGIHQSVVGMPEGLEGLQGTTFQFNKGGELRKVTELALDFGEASRPATRLPREPAPTLPQLPSSGLFQHDNVL